MPRRGQKQRLSLGRCQFSPTTLIKASAILFHARRDARRSLITKLLIALRAFATKLSHCQCPTPGRASIRRLSPAVTSSELLFFRRVDRIPCPTGSISLQKFCDLFFRQIRAVHVRIAFRNASVVGKDHQVKISVLLVEDADSFV